MLLLKFKHKIVFLFINLDILDFLNSSINATPLVTKLWLKSSMQCIILLYLDIYSGHETKANQNSLFISSPDVQYESIMHNAT